jgi:hypothetical protein
VQPDAIYYSLQAQRDSLIVSPLVLLGVQSAVPPPASPPAASLPLTAPQQSALTKSQATPAGKHTETCTHVHEYSCRVCFVAA